MVYDGAILEHAERLEIEDQALAEISNNIVDFLIKNKLHSISRRKGISSTLAMVKDLAFYAPRISMLTAHTNFAVYLLDKLFEINDVESIVSLGLLEPTSRSVSLSFNIDDLGDCLSLTGTKMFAYHGLSDLAIIIGRRKERCYLVLVRLEDIPKPTYHLALKRLGLGLSIINFKESRIFGNYRVVEISSSVVELIRVFLDLLEHHIRGIKERLLEETRLYSEEDRDGDIISSKNKHIERYLTDNQFDATEILNIMYKTLNNFGVLSIVEGTLVNHFLMCLVEGLAYYYDVKKMALDLYNLFA